MAILNKVAKKPGIAMTEILGEFPDDERDNIYPSLGKNIIASLVGELELLGYVEVKDNKVTHTDKGVRKFESYKASLTPEEKKALKL
jgi:hypothetical protein